MVEWGEWVGWGEWVEYGSYGITNSFGVDCAIFLADKKRTFSIFGTEVSESRFNDVWSKICELNNGWFPKFNTAYIWLKKAGEWSKVDASKIESTLGNRNEPYEAWKDMPKETIEYLKSLSEFNAEIFRKVTGIDVSGNDKKQELLNKVQKLLDEAEELKKEAEKFIK